MSTGQAGVGGHHAGPLHDAQADAPGTRARAQSRDAGTTRPQRFQRSRAPGWRCPIPGAVYVGRGSEWGNPAAVSDRQRGGIWWVRRGPDDPSPQRFTDRRAAYEAAVEHYRERLRQNPDFVARVRRVLRGRNVLCWCRIEDDDGSRFPCHGDVLICVAAGDEP
jgi:hypothetical protein